MTAESEPLLGLGGLIFVGLYLLSLIGIGLAGRIARKENSLSDFYLAGRGMGIFVLFLTLYATQYSGNTFIGFAGKAYRGGYTAIVMVVFMTSVIGAYLIYAPKLFQQSRKYNFITIGDYIQNRFQYQPLTYLIVFLSIIALGNYILTNLKAIGYIVEASSGGRVGFAQGIIVLSLIMVLYETLGGMRSVAWTDVIQGVLLMAGAVIIFIAIQIEYGGFVEAGRTILIRDPDAFLPPGWEEKRQWLSTICLAFFGISVYPHAIQRIYAAKSEATLIRSFQLMAFMPIFTTLFMVVVGWVGLAQFPNLAHSDSERITLILLKDIGQRLPIMGALIVLFLSAAIAAIMSTVDSALLAISSMVTNDLYGRIKPDTPQPTLTKIGKVSSWIIMVVAVYLAIITPQTIWRIMEIKLELLCQIAPAVFLGLHNRQLRADAVFKGVVAGTAVAVGIMILNNINPGFPAKPWGIHGGIWGLMSNVGVLVLVQGKAQSTS